MKNNQGLSLVELLVSIVILSIVIVSFMSFFSQSMKFSRIIEEKLAAINIAEEILSNAKKNPEEEPIKLLTEQQIELNKKKYYAEISITQSSEEKKLALKRIQVKIFNTKEHDSSLKPVTEIYGYAQVGGL